MRGAISSPIKNLARYCLRSVQDHFARYPAHGLLATTHLLLRNPEGDKFHFALKWGIPAVADRWAGTGGGVSCS